MHVQTRPMTMIDNARLGMLLFIAAEVMFFAGLVGAYLVFRMGGEIWPPPGQPRLPVLTTALNTLFLLASGWTIRLASRMVRRQDAIRWEKATLILGLVFLVIQGLEWWRLMQYGLTVEIGPYGFTFYVLVGFHGLHVLGALFWRSADVWRTAFSETMLYKDTDPSRMYWYFVVGLWPVLYGLVYLY